MEKIYGFVWHDSVCQAFETESENEIAAAAIMHIIVHKEMAFCEDNQCEHTPIIIGKLTVKMIRNGMTENMTEIQTPKNKRELVLRAMLALARFTPEQLKKSLNEFPLAIRKFLNDADCLKKPTQEEIEEFNLGADFLINGYPRIKKALENSQKEFKLITFHSKNQKKASIGKE